MKGVLIGAGNVAWHLAPALRKAGVEWVQVYSRTEEHARKMALHLGLDAGDPAANAALNAAAIPANGVLPYTCREEEILAGADFYFFAVKDEALRELASRLRFEGSLAVHVSGSVPLETMRQVSARCGVLYPFQTFSITAPCPDLSQTPLCLEASDPDTLKTLCELAGKISGTVRVMSSAQRAALHLGGVFACNYTNFMYKAAYDLMQDAGVEFNLLLPLIQQTARKQDGQDPAFYQTGPAVRGDSEILEQQTAALGSTEKGRKYLEIYKLLAQALCPTTKKNSRK